jgi:hypothetical protein
VGKVLQNLIGLGAVVYTYLGGRDQEDHSSRPVQVKSSQDPHLNQEELSIIVHACQFSQAGSINRRTAVWAVLYLLCQCFLIPESFSFFFFFFFWEYWGLNSGPCAHQRATPLNLLTLDIFLIGSPIYVQISLDHNPPIYASCIAR